MRRVLFTVLGYLVLTATFFGATELGPPYNQPWEQLRSNERIVVVPGQTPATPAVVTRGAANVDTIDGYKSVKFGTTLEHLAQRLRAPRSGNVPDPLRIDGSYLLRVFYPGEETYADLPVKVTVGFVEGQVLWIEIAFLRNDTAAYVTAFQQKYGPANAGSLCWRGKDVEYRIHEFASGGATVRMKSLKLENELRERRAAEQKKRETDADAKAKQLRRDF